jgi:hypothetical protein
MIEWKRTVGNNGAPCWESILGRAYSSECPPTSAPLTRAQFHALPNETPIIVLWGGGNGPHQYVLRDGRAAIRGERSIGSEGAIGRVGDWPMENKVWIDSRSPADHVTWADFERFMDTVEATK